MNIRKMLHYEEEGKIALQKEETLRLIVGFLGILLPFFLYFSVLLYSEYYSVMPSISHYYFTRGSFFFHLVVIIFSLILIIYKGYDEGDFWVSFIAGVAALVVLFFPTNNIDDYLAGKPYLIELTRKQDDIVITQMKNNKTETIHLISAAIFFLSLAYMSIFLFTRVRPRNSKETVYLTKGRILQNQIYYTCGGLITASILVMFMAHKTSLIDEEFYEKNQLTFWLECVALFAFAFSWLTKSNKLIKGEVIKQKDYESAPHKRALKKRTAS